MCVWKGEGGMQQEGRREGGVRKVGRVTISLPDLKCQLNIKSTHSRVIQEYLNEASKEDSGFVII